MKKLIVIDIDTDRESPINIYDNLPDVYDPIGDLDILSDALCVLVHVCEKKGLQPDYKSLEQCIKRLENGFMDTEFTVTIQPDGIGKRVPDTSKLKRKDSGDDRV